MTSQSLTLDDLARWAGDTIVNRGKRYVKNVGPLYQAPDGAFAAWVSGSDEYATSVRIVGRRRFEDFCTCPYVDGPCKHAVAVLLAATERSGTGEVIPPLEEDEDLAQALSGDAAALETWRPGDTLSAGEALLPPRTRATLEKTLSNKSREELVRLLLELAEHYPEVARHVRENEQLAGGHTSEIVRALREEIRSLSSERAWYNHWHGDGHLPDYSHVAERLQKLLDLGHADAVIELGEELWTLGHAQVEQSDDEGHTAMEVAACMEVVLAALPRSSLAPAAQLLWVIDRALEDELSLLHSAGELLARRDYTRSHWREVADALEARLEAMPRSRTTGFMARYRRERLLNALLEALRRGGRKARVIPLLEAEADVCWCYGQLVDALLAAGRRDRARHWCVQGYAQTVQEAPGIAADLQTRLRRMAEREGRRDLAAAYRAEDFFELPSQERFIELRKAAKKAKCWRAVRAAALHYLETGQRPKSGHDSTGSRAWPLPAPEVRPPEPRNRRSTGRYPNLDALIEIAILENRPADVVELHGRLRRNRRRNPDTENAVARAVVDTYPQVALDIWRERVDQLIAEVKPRAYQQAAAYLRRMHEVYARHRRLTDWENLIEELRGRHKAKRRLMEVLDNLPAGKDHSGN